MDKLGKKFRPEDRHRIYNQIKWYAYAAAKMFDPIGVAAFEAKARTERKREAIANGKAE